MVERDRNLYNSLLLSDSYQEFCSPHMVVLCHHRKRFLWFSTNIQCCGFVQWICWGSYNLPLFLSYCFQLHICSYNKKNSKFLCLSLIKDISSKATKALFKRFNLSSEKVLFSSNETLCKLDCALFVMLVGHLKAAIVYEAARCK